MDNYIFSARSKMSAKLPLLLVWLLLLIVSENERLLVWPTGEMVET